jgi:hypothetical protein
MASRWIGIILLLTTSTILVGCSALSGFSFWEDPAIYGYSVSDVANQISCELEAFADEQKKSEVKKDPNSNDHFKWVLDESSDVSVKLNLTTDHQGYVDFTGINLAKLGFTSLASLVAPSSSTSLVPSLGAKVSAKRTRTAEIDFTVSAKPLKANKPSTGGPAYNCQNFSLHNNPLTHLFLKDWLGTYFERINADYHNKPVPNQLKIQQVELSSAIFLAVDVSAGATPTLLSGGSTFIVPINGLGLDYNPDYQHKIDMTIKMCDNSMTYDYVAGKWQGNPCYKDDKTTNSKLPNGLLDEQCKIYSYLVPLLSGVKPPKDKEGAGGTHWVCNKEGIYVPKEDAPFSKPLPPRTPQGPV